MKLTKEQEQATFDACEDAMTEGLSHHDAARFRRGFIACAERMQDEIAKLRKVIDAGEQRNKELGKRIMWTLHCERHCKNGHNASCHYQSQEQELMKANRKYTDALTKVGLDQREAKGDGDE